MAALLWLLMEWWQLFAGFAIARVAVLLAGLMIGWRMPDFLLSRFAARRRTQLERGLPDALDLLVICAEAGLSLDQAIEQVSEDLRASNPAIAEEFAITASEMRVLSNRGAALENFARRTGVASLRSVTVTLNQALRFGTPLAQSMRSWRRRCAMRAYCASRSARRVCRYCSPSRWRCSYCLRCFWLSARRWRFTFPTPYPACRWVPGDLPSGPAEPIRATAPGSPVSIRFGGDREIAGHTDAASHWRPCGNLAFGE